MPRTANSQYKADTLEPNPACSWLCWQGGFARRHPGWKACGGQSLAQRSWFRWRRRATAMSPWTPLHQIPAKPPCAKALARLLRVLCAIQDPNPGQERVRRRRARCGSVEMRPEPEARALIRLQTYQTAALWRSKLAISDAVLRCQWRKSWIRPYSRAMQLGGARSVQ